MQRLQAWRGVLTGLFIGWLAGCGGGNSGSAGGGNTPAPVPSKLVGGSIQGNALSVQGTVSTFPGSGPAADGTGTTAHFYHPTGIATDGTNLYVADTYNNSIRRMVVATGMVTTLAGGTAGNAEGMGTAARFNHPSGIISDGTNLYVTDSDNNCIRQIVITTGKVTTLAGGTQGYADGTGSAARFDHPSGITSDGTNLYVADTYNTRIRQIVIASGVVTTLAGSTQGYAEGTGTAAQFYRPTGITLVGTSLYVTDSDINNIRQIVIASGVVTTLANTNNPTGITTDGINLYVTDSNHNGIRQIVIATKTVTPLAGSNIGSYGTANGTGGAAQFNTPSGITTDGTNLYVADSNNNLIRHIVISTATVTTSAGTASSYGTADGTGNAAQFESPNGLTTDGANLYMTDNHRIRQIGIASGSVTTLAGSPTGGYADGTGGAAQFYYPNGITTDGINLFVADSGNHRIRQIVIATGVVTTLAGGIQGTADGTGSAAQFSYPTGITTDGTNLYVVDRNNNRIRQIVIATGVVTTLAGGIQGTADGTGSAAQFSYPTGITTDGTDLYVVDRGNDRIRKIVIATASVTTLAGGVYGAADGTSSAAQFLLPNDITTDGTNLYVSDSGNINIRQIVIATGVVTTLAGGASGIADGTGSAAQFGYPYGITTNGKNLYMTDSGNYTIRKIQ